MKYIGIVAGAKPEQATALKAALIAKDPLVKVVIEETAMRATRLQGPGRFRRPSPGFFSR